MVWKKVPEIEKEVIEEGNKPIGTVKIPSWKGKSSIELIKSKQLDKIIAIKWQRPEKGEEPEAIRTEISKRELNAMITSINRLNKGEPIKTRDLAGGYFQILEIKEDNKGNNLFDMNGFRWDVLFNWRVMHNKITIILGVLDELGCIDYRGGKTRVLKKDFDIQEVLK